MSLLELTSWILAAFAGAIAHELAHWLVWKASGRQPDLRVWALEVIPRAGVATVTPSDRAAAAAPYVAGAVAIAWGLSAGAMLAVVFGIGMVQLPSRADVETIRGRVVWRSLVA